MLLETFKVLHTIKHECKEKYNVNTPQLYILLCVHDEQSQILKVDDISNSTNINLSSTASNLAYLMKIGLISNIGSSSRSSAYYQVTSKGRYIAKKYKNLFYELSNNI